MYHFYFFRIERMVNQSSQLRTILRPLPGQFTYKTRIDRHHPVDTSYRVQLCNSENHLAVQLTLGDIVGVKHEGPNEKACRLCEYSRNDVPFYRTDAQIFFICDSDGEQLGCRVDMPHADDEMVQAYLRLSASHDNADEHADASATAPAAAAISNAVSVAGSSGNSLRSVPVSTLSMDELNRIEDYLRDRFSERDALGRLLAISQIRDRMRHGVARFVYHKQNGDVRVAYGTRNREVIETIAGPSSENINERNEANGGHFSYFDIQRRAWRCFCTPDISSVDTSVLIQDIPSIRSLAEL